MDYHSYINSKEWKTNKRTEVLRRSGGVCERCHKWPVVNVHHLTYERLGNELLEDLLGVCTKCHKELHV
jgi:hypothetical protein